MKTITDIMKMTCSEQEGDALLAFKMINAIYTEDEILLYCDKNVPSFYMDDHNIFAGKVYLFHEKDWLKTNGCILIGEWKKFYIVITASKCFLKKKDTFRGDWLTKDIRNPILNYINYK